MKMSLLVVPMLLVSLSSFGNEEQEVSLLDNVFGPKVEKCEGVFPVKGLIQTMFSDEQDEETKKMVGALDDYRETGKLDLAGYDRNDPKVDNCMTYAEGFIDGVLLATDKPAFGVSDRINKCDAKIGLNLQQISNYVLSNEENLGEDNMDLAVDVSRLIKTGSFMDQTSLNHRNNVNCIEFADGVFGGRLMVSIYKQMLSSLSGVIADGIGTVLTEVVEAVVEGVAEGNNSSSKESK
ncbi:MAG: hypothetical protein AB8E15_12640 [Bdellovibrionales bacterium]